MLRHCNVPNKILEKTILLISLSSVFTLLERYGKGECSKGERKVEEEGRRGGKRRSRGERRRGDLPRL